VSRIQDHRDVETFRVLHVDDNPDYLALAAEFLGRVGPLDVVSETDTETALARVRDGVVDCVVSDFDMAGTDGLDFFAQVRAVDTAVPFILFTGKGSEEIAAEAISEGVTDYVQKRGGREQYEVLANRVENAVERARAAAKSRDTVDRLHETFDRITDSFLAIDTDWRITYVNDRGASFLGESVDDLLGRDLRTLTANGAARFHEEYQQALQTQEPVSFEAESLTHPGRWLDIRAYPAEDGLSIYWRDVTTLRQRERVLAALYTGARELLSCETTDDLAAHAVKLTETVLGFDEAALYTLSGGAETSARTVATSTDVEPTATEAGLRVLADRVEAADGPVVVGERGPAGVDVAPGVYVAVGEDRLLAAQGVEAGSDDFEVRCVQWLAATVETALSRTRRERELEANRNVVHALHGSAMEFQTCGSVEEVLDVAVRCARDIVSFDRCLFAQHRDGRLERVAQSDDLPGIERSLSTDVGVSGRAYRTGETVVVDDTLRNDVVRRPCPYRSLLTVPLDGWGVFQAVAAEPNAFDTTDAELAELLAMHARAALSRVASDERLRRERDLLAAFFESSGEPVVRVRFDDDHARARIDRVNPAFERVFGLDAAAVEDDVLDDHIVPPDERDAARQFNERSNAGEPVEAEVRRLTADGPREFLFRSVPFRGDDDSPMAYGIYVDITARKRRERDLERYRTIVESTGDPVYTLDAEGDITYVNEAFGTMTGYDTGALIGEHMGLLVPDPDVERSEALIRDLLCDEGRTNDTVELDLVRADGTRVRCENHIALLPFDEEFQGTAGAIRDITDRKQRKRELKAQNERLDQFASVVSHDLRNPLQVAQGHLELAREHPDDDESLDRVEGALDRIDAIVDDVLTLAREGRGAPDVSETAIDAVARRAWDSVDTADASLVVETSVLVDADERRLQRLFENLFRNSVEHGSTDSRPAAGDSVEHGSTADDPEADDPSVTVRVGHVGDGDCGAFFVEDDGEGIAPDERDRVFESGYSTSSDGTGFGLDIVSTIATSHGWDVGLSDGTLGGVRFTVHTAD
jgi:PAS domain S-box-containing protein